LRDRSINHTVTFDGSIIPLHFPTYAVQAAVLCGSVDIFFVGGRLRKVAEGLRFGCGQYGSFTVGVRGILVLQPRRTAGNHKYAWKTHREGKY